MLKYKCIVNGIDVCSISICEQFPAPNTKAGEAIIIRGNIFDEGNKDFNIAKKVQEHIIDNAGDNMNFSFVFPHCRAGRIDVDFYGENMSEELWEAFRYAFSGAILFLCNFYLKQVFKNSNAEVERREKVLDNAQRTLSVMAQEKGVMFQLVRIENNFTKVAQDSVSYNA